jgi:hypothetical protein
MKTDRGEFIGGKRVDSATYFIRREGSYTLPSVRVEWWNLNASRVQTAVLPAIQFVAASNSSADSELAPEPEAVPAQAPPQRASFRHYAQVAEAAVITLLALMLLLWIWLRFGSRFRERWKQWRIARRDSEAAYFALLRKACRTGDSRDAYRLFLAWLRRSYPGINVSRFLSEAGDGELKREVESLAAILYGRFGSNVWSGDQMIEALRRLRRQHRRVLRKRQHAALPPLNPAISSEYLINRFRPKST